MRESSIERLVGTKGISEEEKRQFIEEIGQEIFEKARHLEVAGEVAKTEEQIKLCAVVDQLTGEIVLKYGGRNLTLTPEHVRITENPTEKMEKGLGQFQPERQLVLLRPTVNDLEFAYATAHEFLHFKSHGVMQIPLGHEDQSPDMYYRVGLRLNNRTDTEVYFNALEEGMTEELAKRLIKKLKQEWSSFGGVMAETEKQIVEQDLDEDLQDDLIYLDQMGEGRRFTYIKERSSLKLLFAKIVERCPEQFENEEQVFDMFAKAKFSGNILPLGRLIDKTFGIGTFRRLGEAYSGDDLKTVVESL